YGAPRAGPSSGERMSDDRGITSFRDDFFRFFPRLRKSAARHLETSLVHRLFKQETILGGFDRIAFRANHLDVVLAQHASIFERDREIERSLPADCRQQ